MYSSHICQVLTSRLQIFQQVFSLSSSGTYILGQQLYFYGLWYFVEHPSLALLFMEMLMLDGEGLHGKPWYGL